MEMTKKQQLKIANIAKRYSLRLVILFGSFADGKDGAESDMDIAVQFKKESISFKKLIKLSMEMSQIFGEDIDLSVINRANPLLFKQISQNGVLLFGTHNDFTAFKTLAFHRYNDYLPFFKLEEEANKKYLKIYAH
jgi:predicted nucleotidyltransferase